MAETAKLPPTIYYIRHGETDWNVAGRLQGRHDVPLNGRGRAQATHCGDILRDLFARDGRNPADLDYVSSPLGRARKTMELLRASLGLPADGYEIEPRLAEIAFGDWEGFTIAQLHTRDPQRIAAREQDKWHFVPPGGESYKTVSGTHARMVRGAYARHGSCCARRHRARPHCISWHCRSRQPPPLSILHKASFTYSGATASRATPELDQENKTAGLSVRPCIVKREIRERIRPRCDRGFRTSSRPSSPSFFFFFFLAERSVCRGRTSSRPSSPCLLLLFLLGGEIGHAEVGLLLVLLLHLLLLFLLGGEIGLPRSDFFSSFFSIFLLLLLLGGQCVGFDDAIERPGSRTQAGSPK